MAREKYKSIFKEESNLTDTSLIDKIFEWFKNNPYPKDHEQLHTFAESLGLEANVIEEYVYAIVSCFVAGGNFNKKKADASKFDPEEIKMGQIVESEHLDSDNSNPVIQHIVDIMKTRISYDHLADNEKYYSQAKEGTLQIEELVK